MTPFENLKKAFPVFTVKSNLSYSKEIPMGNGDSVMVPPLGVRRIASANLINMPDRVSFELIDPPVSALIQYGVIKNPVESAEPITNDE